MNIKRPPPRQWIANNSSAIEDGVKHGLLNIMSSNILSERYTTGQLVKGYDGLMAMKGYAGEINNRATYTYCPDIYLDWEYRKGLVIKEIQAINPDIACLQEVEAAEFENFFKKELSRLGYKGIFCARSSGTRKRDNEEARKVDGCATFYKTHKLTLLDTKSIDFNASMHDTSSWADKMAKPLCGGMDKCKKEETNEYAFEMIRLMTSQGPVALCSMFRTTDEFWPVDSIPKNSEDRHKHLLICNSHLESTFTMPDVRIVQSMILAKNAEEFMANYDESQLVICGDLNSLRESGCLRYLTKGKISLGDPEFHNLPYKNLLDKMFGKHDENGCYTHNLELTSAISHDIMPYSCLQPDFRGMIDHILYQRKGFELSESLKGPVDDAWLKKNKIIGAPSQHLPSDHFPLAAKLWIKQETKLESEEDDEFDTEDELQTTVGIKRPTNTFDCITQ